MTVTGASTAVVDRSALMHNYAEPPVTFVRGEGSRLFDTEGRPYLDFLSGLAVTSLGHAHPVVADAIAEQARTLSHVSNLFGNTVGPEVAVTLDRLIGGGTERAGGQVFFGNSGAEANECALKLARRWAGPDRFGVVSTWDAFHGRTLATLTATGQPEKQQPFLPLPQGFDHVPYDDLEAMDAACDPSRVAAVLVEPIMGEAGVVVPSSDYLVGLRQLCTDRNILLMVDEVQTGLGRAGRWFGFQHLAIEPDVVTMAKALGNGMPVGACWARAEVAAAFVPGDHGSTFGGQPLAMSAARATLSVMEAEDVPARARVAGARLRPGWRSSPGWSSVRGEGLLLAAVLERGGGRRRLPAGARARPGHQRPEARRPPVRPFAAGVRRRDRPGGGHGRRGPRFPGQRVRWRPGTGRGAGPVVTLPIDPAPAWTRHVLDIDDLGPDGLDAVLALAQRDPSDLPPVLAGQGVALVFEKPSNRTRNSTEMATVALGGHPVYIQGTEVGLDTREPAADVARTLACYHAVVVCPGHGARHPGPDDRRPRRRRGAGSGRQPALGPGPSVPGPGRLAHAAPGLRGRCGRPDAGVRGATPTMSGAPWHWPPP